MRRWIRVSLTSFFAAVLCVAVYYSSDLQMPAASAAASTSSTLQANIKSHLNLREESFTIRYNGQTNGLSAQVDKAINAVLDADDRLGYTVSSFQWHTSFTHNEATITVQVNYWENAKQTAFVLSQTKQIAKEILKPGMNTHEKVKAVHDWVLLHVAYDRTLVEHSSYAALTGGKTVCQGYALLTYRLLNEAGIPNRIAEGRVSTGLHAWNLVNLDGKWYHLDTTFDDPVPDVKGRTTYDYYLLTDKQIRRDHRWTKAYPAAVTSYADSLNTLKTTDKQKAVFYGDLEHTLGYQYLKPENTVKTMEQLTAKVKTAFAAGQTSVRVRWTGGSSLSLQKLLRSVPALSAVQYDKKPFAHGNPADVILYVAFK